jgi:molecular chaperone DnaK (HSP70)
MTVIAIDFGTSNTVVSILEPDTQTPKTLRFPSLSRVFSLGDTIATGGEIAVIPSLVYIGNGREIIIGDKVRSQRLGLSQPQRFFRAFKRDLAADFQIPPRTIDDKVFDSHSVAVAFLTQIWQEVLAAKIEPSLVIFTVPVGTFERYLDWFKDVAILFQRGYANELKLPAVKFVDESTAAALGYAVQRPGSIVLVADFGGGTLDLSLVRTSPLGTDDVKLQAEVLAKTDVYVGGEDIDRWIIEDYLIRLNSDRESIGEVGWQNLLAIAERLKIRLTNDREARESWLDEDTFMSYDLTLDRSQLEELLEQRQLLEQFHDAIDEILTLGLRKGVQKTDIEQILLVGGSCQIQAIQQLFISYFGRQRVKLHKPFEAVAHGALALTQIAGLSDYLRHGYCIRLWEPYTRTYNYFPLFEAGIKYPCTREEPLTLQVAIEGQTEIRLDIGEIAQISTAEVTYDAQGRMSSIPVNKQSQYRSLERDSHSETLCERNSVCLARLEPPGELGIDRIAVEFAVTEQRILVVTVTDLFTNRVLVERGSIAKLN